MTFIRQDVQFPPRSSFDVRKAPSPFESLRSSLRHILGDLLSELHLPLTWAGTASLLNTMAETIATGNFGNATSGSEAPLPMRPRALKPRQSGMHPAELKPPHNVNISDTNVDPNIQPFILCAFRESDSG
jgi:hypothetical protein